MFENGLAYCAVCTYLCGSNGPKSWMYFAYAEIRSFFNNLVQLWEQNKPYFAVKRSSFLTNWEAKSHSNATVYLTEAEISPHMTSFGLLCAHYPLVILKQSFTNAVIGNPNNKHKAYHVGDHIKLQVNIFMQVVFDNL